MATLDELEALAAPKPPTASPPCGTVMGPTLKGMCPDCEFAGDTPKIGSKKWVNGAGQEESMRYCYNFCSFVPARATFTCSLFTPRREKG